MDTLNLATLVDEELAAARAATSGRSARTIHGRHQHALKYAIRQACRRQCRCRLNRRRRCEALPSS